LDLHYNFFNGSIVCNKLHRLPLSVDSILVNICGHEWGTNISVEFHNGLLSDKLWTCLKILDQVGSY